MTNSGKSLEALVKVVEKILLPEGFVISAREKIFNEEGVQIAELDLIVSGKLGSTKLEWLIECRDRPSEGSAPVSWIEQLVGRRDRLGFNKVTAVSTTGFSPGATEFAQESGIELRTVEEINEAVIQEWFKVTQLNVVVTRGDLQHIRLFLDPKGTDEQLNAFKKILGKQDPNEPFFIHTGTGENLSVNGAWRAFLGQNHHLYDDVSPEAEPKELKVLANYTNPESRYKVVLDEDEFHISKILFIGELTVKVLNIPIASVKEYGNVLEGDTIAQSIHFEVDTGEETLDLALHKVEGDSGTLIFASSVPMQPDQDDENRAG